MPGMMSPMMDGMMSGRTRGCMMMAEGMMKGQFDLARLRKTLALPDEEVERLRAGVRPFQKEDILAHAAMKVATLELADLLAGEKVDFGKVEAKLKEIEGLRTKARLAQLKAADAVKGILSTEQLEMLQGAGECTPPPAEPRGAAPQSKAEHQRHH
jgi:Spy/CpxP family protein refolding chaperone